MPYSWVEKVLVRYLIIIAFRQTCVKVYAKSQAESALIFLGNMCRRFFMLFSKKAKNISCKNIKNQLLSKALKDNHLEKFYFSQFLEKELIKVKMTSMIFVQNFKKCQDLTLVLLVQKILKM